MSIPSPSRRDFVKRLTYVAPSVLTLAAAPEYAKAGSVKPDGWGGRPKPDRGRDWDFGFGGPKGRGGPGAPGGGSASGGARAPDKATPASGSARTPAGVAQAETGLKQAPARSRAAGISSEASAPASASAPRLFR